MTRAEPHQGRHRATTVPRYWDHPDGRRHLTGTPGFDWFAADGLPQLGPYEPVPPAPAFPAPGERPEPAPDTETTQEIPIPLGVLPPALAGPDPEPTGPLPIWATGPLPVLPPPRDDAPPSMRWAWAIGVYLLLAVAAALFALALAPPT